jgi:hypothetical protein
MNLHEAILDGQIEIVKKLIQNPETDVNKYNEFGFTPITMGNRIQSI